MNLETQLKNLELQFRQLLRVLKYQMAMPLEENIALANEISGEENQVPEAAPPQPDTFQRTEISLLGLQDELNRINLKRLKASGFPSLSLVGRYQFLAFGNGLGELFGSDYWYSAGMLGLQVDIPLFDGFRKKARVAQAELQGEEWKEDLRFTHLSLELQQANARQSLQANLNNLQSLKENRRVAEEVYQLTQNRLSEGIAPITELLSAETAMREAQTNYFTALLEVKLAELELQYSQGKLLEEFKL